MATANGFTNWPTELVVMVILNDGGLYRRLVTGSRAASHVNCRAEFMAYKARNAADFEDCGPGFFSSVNWYEVADNLKKRREEVI